MEIRRPELLCLLHDKKAIAQQTLQEMLTLCGEARPVSLPPFKHHFILILAVIAPGFTIVLAQTTCGTFFCM